jgi:putative FmdB family regulatory protein
VPRYDYRCSVCGHEVELLHGIHDPGPRVCPNCGAEGSMRKAFATPAVHYKGSGWAKKDRSTSSSRSTAASGSKDGSKEGSKDGSGSSSDSSSSHAESGDGGTSTSASTTESSSTGDGKKSDTGKGSTPKPSSDRGAA